MPRDGSEQQRHHPEPLYRIVPHHRQPYHPSMFRTVDVFVGQILQFIGPTARDSRWRVVKVQTDMGYGRGWKRVDYCNTTRDLVTLHPVGASVWGERPATFAYLQGSSRWIIPPPYAGRYPHDIEDRVSRIAAE